MRPLLLKNLFFFSSSSSFSSSPALALLLQVSHISTSSNYTPPYSRRHDEESRNVRVSVWWDFENCQIPVSVNVFKLAPAITEAVRANGIKGPIQITAFGDVLQLSRANQEVLSATGITLTHIPNGGKNSADRSLLVDLMYWVSQNPPPAHLFLISGDSDFAGILHRLRMNNYNILLAIPGRASDVLCSAATIMWQWNSLLKGENLSGKHFNHPPDGPYGSWYGNYKVPLEAPFSVGEHSTSFQNVETSEPTSDIKLGPIPKSAMRQVRQIVSSHPKGISITDLRAELAKSDSSVNRHLYGYKRFSRFLLAIPGIHLQSLGDGQFNVSLIPSGSPESFETSVAPSTTSTVKNEEQGYATTPKLNGESKIVARDIDGTRSGAPLHEKSMDNVPKKFQEVPLQGKPVGEFVDDKSSVLPFVENYATQFPNELLKSSQINENAVDVTSEQLSEIRFVSKENEMSKSEVGSLKTSYNKLRDNETNAIANDSTEKFRDEEKYEKLTRKEADEVCHIPDSSLVNSSEVDKQPGGSTETSSKSPSFLSWIKSWWPFRKSSRQSDALTAQQNKMASHSEESKLLESDQIVSHSEKPELFSSGSFWIDMESFVFSPKGSLLFSQSRSREDMIQKLQKYGPLVLRSLSETHILLLVDLLIAEKKWVEESSSQAFPFRLTQPVRRSLLPGQSQGANGLRSLFLSKTSESSLPKSFKNDAEKQNQGIAYTGVPTPATKLSCTVKSRTDILADCQKLVDEVLREHPEGYNIGSFQKRFVERYGYHLDIHKLGYKRLASLLQIMPGVKLESTYMFPSVHFVSASDEEASIPSTPITKASHAASNSDSELSDSAPKDDNIDSPWEELGPVSVNNSNQSDVESKLLQKAKELDLSKLPDYEPELGHVSVDNSTQSNVESKLRQKAKGLEISKLSEYEDSVSDDDSSESEGERSCLTQPQRQRKPKCNEQDSAFWQHLDLWHSSREGENNVEKSDDVNALCNSLSDILNSSTESSRGTQSKVTGNIREKQKSLKNYSFVADPVLPSKDKLIDGILDGFKKADESRMQN